MATVLLTWELGGGFGHISRLAAIAHRLDELGHRPVLAVKNVPDTHHFLRDTKFPVFQAPYWHPRAMPGGSSFQASTYADILSVHGFADFGDLRSMVDAWQSIIDAIDARLIIADHSPTVCVAAHGWLPVMQVGSGFIVPPSTGHDFPYLGSPRPELVATRELHDVVCQVQRARGRTSPPSLPALFATADQFILTWPELDPYQSHRGETIAAPMVMIEPRKTQPSVPAFFAYLAAEYPSVEAVLVRMAAALPGEAYVRGACQVFRNRLRDAGIKVHDTPPEISDVLERVTVIVHHGGNGVAETALGGGCPQLLLPRHIEQLLISQALEKLSIGCCLSGTIRTSKIVQRTIDLSRDENARRAADLAQALSARNTRPQFERLINRCLELIVN